MLQYMVEMICHDMMVYWFMNGLDRETDRQGEKTYIMESKNFNKHVYFPKYIL